MQLYKRPKKPPRFDAEVAPLKKAVAALVKKLMEKEKRAAARAKAAKKKAAGKGRKAKKEAIKFKDAWKKYKEVFAETQFYKCGFCESAVKKTGYGDVEHYYPKGAVWGRRPAAGGRKRSQEELSPFGYWWLAYDWTNYLFSCAKCNQKFKRSFFPVQEDPRRLPPSRRIKETPLLLNPYNQLDPGQHLAFLSEGLVMARDDSQFGDATIKTCGLNRKDLVVARRRQARRAYRSARQLRSRTGRRDEELLQDCYNLGRDDEEHSGMVRLIFKEVAGIDWDVMVGICARALCRLRPDAYSVEAEELDEFIEVMGRERFEHSTVVRYIYERTCRESWADLVKRLASRRARDSKSFRYPAEIYLELYEMACGSPSYAVMVQCVFEAESGISWESLLNELKDQDIL